LAFAADVQGLVAVTAAAGSSARAATLDRVTQFDAGAEQAVIGAVVVVYGRDTAATQANIVGAADAIVAILVLGTVDAELTRFLADFSGALTRVALWAAALAGIAEFGAVAEEAVAGAKGIVGDKETESGITTIYGAVYAVIAITVLPTAGAGGSSFVTDQSGTQTRIAGGEAARGRITLF